MIFAISPGSEGSGDERYVVYLPFVLAPGADLNPFDGPVSVPAGMRTLKLEKLQHLYALSLGPFNSMGEAAEHVTRLRASLLWLSLQSSVGISYSRQLGAVELHEVAQPVPDSGMMTEVAGAVGWDTVDGNYDADKAMIRPDHKRLIRWELGRPSIRIGLAAENLLETVSDALSFERLGAVADNAKLRLSIELYAAHRFEVGENAQFITLVSALEALTPSREISETAINGLTAAKEVVKERRDRERRDSAEWEELNRLLSRIATLKTEAIGTALRENVKAVVLRHPALGDAGETSIKLRDVYTVRSNLLHEGHAAGENVSEHLAFLRRLVPRVLDVLFREEVGK